MEEKGPFGSISVSRFGAAITWLLATEHEEHLPVRVGSGISGVADDIALVERPGTVRRRVRKSRVTTDRGGQTLLPELFTSFLISGLDETAGVATEHHITSGGQQ